MALSLFPSLVSRANVTITVALWYHEGIVHSTGVQQPREAREMEERVRENLQKLEIPNILKQDILMSIRPIGEEIRKWFHRNGCLVELDVNWSAELCWTYIGFIDYKATALNVLKNRNLSNCQRFRLACVNGLDAYIHALWPFVKLQFKRYLKSSATESNMLFYERGLLLSFEDYLKKQEHCVLSYPENQEILYHQLQESIKLGYVPAADYYLRAIVPSETLLLELAKETLKGSRRFRPACLFLLLKHMDNAQLHQFMLMNSPSSLLLSFLEWPLHQFFESVVNKVWAAVSEQDFHLVLIGLATKILAFEEEVLLYQTIFSDFWQRGSAEYRNYCHQVIVDPILIKLFHPNDPSSALQLLFHDTGIMQKLHMIFITESDAMLMSIIEENKKTAIGNVLKKYIPADVFVPNFEECYYKCTREYLHSYYGDI